MGATGPISASELILQLAERDLSKTLVADSTVLYTVAPRAFTLASVKAFVLSQSFAGQIIIDIKLNGVSIFNTRLSIDVNEHSSLSAIVPAVLAITSIPADGVLSVDVDSAGVGARGLIVTLVGA
jgi:hypothetical protein